MTCFSRFCECGIYEIIPAILKNAVVIPGCRVVYGSGRQSEHECKWVMPKLTCSQLAFSRGIAVSYFTSRRFGLGFFLSCGHCILETASRLRVRLFSFGSVGFVFVGFQDFIRSRARRGRHVLFFFLVRCRILLLIFLIRVKNRNKNKRMQRPRRYCAE